MPEFIPLFIQQPYMYFPKQALGWLGWFVMLGMLIIGILTSMGIQPGSRPSRRWRAVVILAALTPFTALAVGLRLPFAGLHPFPGIPAVPLPPAWMFFLAVPWVLAGGFSGPLVAALLGVFGGLFLGLWETHSPFTPLEFGGLALLFSLALHQPYRTFTYKALRHPLVTAGLLSLLYAPVLVLSTLFMTGGSLAVRVDYAGTQTWPWVLARSLELITAGGIAEVFVLFRTRGWFFPSKLKPSPTEHSLSFRFLSASIPFLLVLLAGLVLVDWLVAGAAARGMLKERMEITADVAADSLPVFMETGQTLIASLSNPELVLMEPEAASVELEAAARSMQYFREFILFDAEGNPVTGYPYDQTMAGILTEEETAGIRLAVNGIPVQIYSIPPAPGETSARLTFIAAIQNEEQHPLGVLIGRTDLVTNPLTQAAIRALLNVRDQGGDALILDETGRVVFHTSSSVLMTEYIGTIPSSASFFPALSATGTRRLVYFQPVTGPSWGVVLSFPAEKAQVLALNIAFPLFGILLASAIFVLFALWLVLREVSQSLQNLSSEAAHIARGNLDRPMSIDRVDEVGLLAASFEQMRQSLKNRMEQINQFLLISQKVASNLDIGESLELILKAAVKDGASMARAVLVPGARLESRGEPFVSYGFGADAELFAHLDRKLFTIMQEHDSLSLPNMQRQRRIEVDPQKPHPGALLAFTLRYEDAFYGVFWIAFPQPHTFSNTEVRYLGTLAGQAAIAAANTSIYASAEIGRQRLEQVLASTPEPILVTDEKNRLVLMNPAAMQVDEMISQASPGSPIETVIVNPDLLTLAQTPLVENHSASGEISLADGRVYFASASAVSPGEKMTGRVIILRDISHYKKLDTLKSEIVSMVSHDLRTPLTYMRGYVSMLEMMGTLNDQQKNYVEKIMLGVENMDVLINDLLDLSRLEAGADLDMKDVSPGDVIQKVVSQLQVQAAQKRISIQVPPFDEGIPTIRADAILLQQALFNLVDNAIRYTNLGGTVAIHVKPQPGSVLFEVTDTGIGIAPLDLPHVFEKFYRKGRHEAHEKHGAGLGLAIVKSIADRHGGRVWVVSQLGKGSTFSLEIPISQPKEEVKR